MFEWKMPKFFICKVSLIFYWVLKLFFFSLVQKWVAHLVCQTSAGRISTVVQWNIWSKFECRGGTVFYQTTKVQDNWLVLAVNLSQRKSFNLFFSMGSGLTGSPEDIIVIITISNFFISCTTIYWISLPFMIAFLGWGVCDCLNLTTEQPYVYFMIV